MQPKSRITENSERIKPETFICRRTDFLKAPQYVVFYRNSTKVAPNTEFVILEQKIPARMGSDGDNQR